MEQFFWICVAILATPLFLGGVVLMFAQGAKFVREDKAQNEQKQKTLSRQA